LLPTYNEMDNIAAAVQSLLREVEASGIRSYEILVVDDGSTDGTRAEALRIADGNRIKVLGYSGNMGKGYATKYGVNKASGSIIVFLDSDLEIDSRLLPTYINALQHFDLVIASKRHPKSRVEAPILRRFLSYGFHILAKLLTGVTVSDTQSGLKAARTEVLKRIFSLLLVKKYAFDLELLVVAQLLDCRIQELPVEIKLGSQFGLREMVRMFVDTLGIAYRLRINGWYLANLRSERPRYKAIIRW